jgi:arylsulfatase A-like enzyme
VTERESARYQFEAAAEKLAQNAERPTFLFINVSALHQPNHFYLDGAPADSVASHAGALRYVDAQLPVLLRALKQRARPTFCILTSDHGTAYGEDGWTGHRLAHPVVWSVPYAEVVVGTERGVP